MESNESRSTTVWSRNLALAILASYCFGSITQMLIPTMPIYLLQQGISGKYAGIMSTAYAMGSVLFRPFAGQLVDGISRRRMLLVGSAICALTGFGYSFTTGFVSLFLLRILNGFGMCLGSTALGAIVADVIPRDRMTEGIGYYGLAGAVSQTISPAIALWAQTLGGIKPVFFLTGAMGLVSVGCGLALRYQDPPRRPREAGKVRFRIYEPNALWPSSMIFLVSLSQCSLTTFLVIYGHTMGLELGSFFAITSIGIVSSRLMAGRIAARYPDQNVLTIACVINACCFVLVSLVTQNWMFIAIALVYGFAYGIVYPLSNSMSLRHVPRETRGIAAATFSGCWDLGILVGNFVWGFVVTGIGYRGMYLCASVLMLCILAIYFKLFRRQFPEG